MICSSFSRQSRWSYHINQIFCRVQVLPLVRICQRVILQTSFVAYVGRNGRFRNAQFLLSSTGEVYRLPLPQVSLPMAGLSLLMKTTISTNEIHSPEPKLLFLRQPPFKMCVWDVSGTLVESLFSSWAQWGMHCGLLDA